MAWEKTPKELVQKAWVVYRYSNIHNLEDESASKELVQYSDQELGSIVENISGAYGMMAWIDNENEPIIYWHILPPSYVS